MIDPYPKKCITIITPVYNEEQNVKDCYQEIVNIFKDRLSKYDYEHIFCDNNSTDNTVNILKQIAKNDKNIKIIVNSRNFGILRSTFHGLLNASGDAVVVLFAADLQDPPGAIADFVEKWEQGYQIVYGVKQDREENFVMRSIRQLYYKMIRRFSYIDIPRNVNAFQLIDRTVLNALKQFEDYYPSLRGMIASCGFRSVGVNITWRKRKKGISKNRLFHLVDEGLNDLISFSNLPMRLSIFLGLIISTASFVRVLYSLGMNFIQNDILIQPGIPTLIVAIFFFSGVQLIFLGVLGEYICAIHFQVRKRPLIIEKERINFEKT